MDSLTTDDLLFLITSSFCWNINLIDFKLLSFIRRMMIYFNLGILSSLAPAKYYYIFIDTLEYMPGWWIISKLTTSKSLSNFLWIQWIDLPTKLLSQIPIDMPFILSQKWNIRSNKTHVIKIILFPSITFPLRYNHWHPLKKISNSNRGPPNSESNLINL